MVSPHVLSARTVSALNRATRISPAAAPHRSAIVARSGIGGVAHARGMGGPQLWRPPQPAQTRHTPVVKPVEAPSATGRSLVEPLLAAARAPPIYSTEVAPPPAVARRVPFSSRGASCSCPRHRGTAWSSRARPHSRSHRRAPSAEGCRAARRRRRVAAASRGRRRRAA